MGGYATHVNRFLSLTLSLMISVTTPLLSFRYASGSALYSALSHLSVRFAPLCSALSPARLVAGDDQQQKKQRKLKSELTKTANRIWMKKKYWSWLPKAKEGDTLSERERLPEDIRMQSMYC